MKSIFSSILLTVFCLSASGQDQAMRPFADYERTGYLIMAAAAGHDSSAQKRTIVQNLPSDVKLILFAPKLDQAKQELIISDYARFIPRSRIIYMTIPKGERGFWARDAVPFPLIGSGGNLILADAHYWDNFEPDDYFSQLFQAPMIKHKKTFEGGNFMTNHLGNCFMVNSTPTDQISNSFFVKNYGCRTVTKLPHVGGIGHIDERARFIDEKTILTDTESYRKVFEKQGYTVHMLPKGKKAMETYVNSIIVNGTVFVPTFMHANDEVALNVYRSVGLKVIGLDSRALSNTGKGSYHCITMNFPAVPLGQVSPSFVVQ
ncbi:MAG: agmatine deiminase family protein [Bdellovibrionota bacterium]